MRSNLSQIGFETSTIHPNRWYLLHSRTPGENSTKLSAVKTAGTEGAVARIVDAIHIWMDILRLKAKVILHVDI